MTKDVISHLKLDLLPSQPNSGAMLWVLFLPFQSAGIRVNPR